MYSEAPKSKLAWISDRPNKFVSNFHSKAILSKIRTISFGFRTFKRSTARLFEQAQMTKIRTFSAKLDRFIHNFFIKRSSLAASFDSNQFKSFQQARMSEIRASGNGRPFRLDFGVIRTFRFRHSTVQQMFGLNNRTKTCSDFGRSV